jgi:hypothetical protein
VPADRARVRLLGSSGLSPKCDSYSEPSATVVKKRAFDRPLFDTARVRLQLRRFGWASTAIKLLPSAEQGQISPDDARSIYFER